MKVNMLKMVRENISLHAYVSDDARDVYLELYGLSWGHLALKDTVPELRNSPKEVGSDDDLKNWHKFRFDSKNLFEGRDNIIDVGSLTSRQKLSPNERQFFRDVINVSLKNLYRYLIANPWVSVNDLPVWDGDIIINYKWPTNNIDYKGRACNFADISVFGDKFLSNYRFDNGCELTAVIDNIPDDFSEYEGSDKIWNFVESGVNKEVDYTVKCDINNAIRRWRYEQRYEERHAQRHAQQHIIQDDKDDTQNNNNTCEDVSDVAIALAIANYGNGRRPIEVDDVEKYRDRYNEIYKDWSCDSDEISDNDDTHYYKIQIKITIDDFTSLKSNGIDNVPYWMARDIMKNMIEPYHDHWMAYRRFINCLSIPDKELMEFNNIVLYCPIRSIIVDILKRSEHNCRITKITKQEYNEHQASWFNQIA